MKKMILCKMLGIIMLPTLLLGCASQLLPLTDTVNTETAVLSESPIESVKPVVPGVSRTVPFASPAQENMYKVLVAEIAAQRGDYKLAAQYFFEVAEQTREARLAERTARIALHTQNYTLAAQAVSLWTTLEPKNVNIHQVLAKILSQQGRIDEAVKHLETILDSIKGTPEQRLEVIAALLQQQKDEPLALKLIEKLLAKQRTPNPTLLLVYARLLINAKQLDRAAEVLQQLFKIAPDHAQAVPLYVHVLMKQNKTEAAFAWLKQLLNKHPDNQEWRLMYARLLAGTEQYADSIQQFKTLLAKNPQQPEILYTLGLLSLQIKQIQPAKGYFLELLKHKDHADMGYYFLGQAAELEKEFNEALAWYGKVIAGANYLNAQARIAVILVEQGQLDKALIHLHTIKANNQEDMLRLIELEAELLINQKRYEQAMTVYDNAIQANADNTTLLYQRAMLAEKMNRLEQTEQDLRRVLALDSKHVQALNALGFSLADHTDRYQEAYELIKQALELRPEDHYIIDSMGWVLYRLGKYAEAVDYLRKAITKQNDPEIAAHLGEVLWVSGDQQAAKIVWEKAVKEFPEHEALQKVVQRFLP